MKLICNKFTPPKQETADMSSPDEGQEEEEGPLEVIPYVAEMSEDIRCELQLRLSLHRGDQQHA